MDIKRAGIFSNSRKDVGLGGAAAVANTLRKRGIEVCFDEGGMPAGEVKAIDYSKIDCLFVLGGDGTLLKAAGKAAGFGVSIVGINFGRLGFLTETELDTFDNSLNKILSGEFYKEKRIMLHCEVNSDKGVLYEFDALNDVAIMKKEIARTIHLKLLINNALADEVHCDGMLISTPTGSTGYSLSAGGPVVDPKIECMLAIPVCPHSLHSRALVISPDDIITIEPCSQGGTVIVADGTIQLVSDNYESVKVVKSKHHVHFIRFKNDYFYTLLRSKFLSWDR